MWTTIAAVWSLTLGFTASGMLLSVVDLVAAR